MILIYTGNGKGKTSACVGQAVRAHGQGLEVAFAQFMKRAGQAGEQVVLEQLLEGNFYAGGRGFFRSEENRPAHREAALETLRWALERLPLVDMLVLDETLYALSARLLTREEVEHLLRLAEELRTHVVLSGRNLPEWLCERADLITDMEEVKHPWRQGVKATPGIEF